MTSTQRPGGEPVYTPEFWRRVEQLLKRAERRCEKCRVLNGEDITPIDGKRRAKRIYAKVLVQLRVGRWVHPDNLGLFCTKCKPGLRIRKAEPGKMGWLFDERK
jgi:hypothetical protein